MAQFMLLVYQEEEVESAVQAERERKLPVLVEMYRSLLEAGLLVSVQRLHSVGSATSVRMRDGETEITDGPFAVTKEVLAGYYILECADLDEALKQAARLPSARWGTVEVRPVMPAEGWLRVTRAAGADVPDEAVEDLAQVDATSLSPIALERVAELMRPPPTPSCAPSSSSAWPRCADGSSEARPNGPRCCDVSLKPPIRAANSTRSTSWNWNCGARPPS